MRNCKRAFKLRRSFHYYRIHLILRHSILACELFGPGHYWMHSCRHLKDYRFDFHTAGTFWEGPGDYRSFIFIYRLLNWISDQWGRTVCARTLSFNWKKEHRRELRRTHNWLCLRVGLGFGGWCTLYRPDIAEPWLGSWECSYLVRTVKGKRPSVCDCCVLKTLSSGKQIWYFSIEQVYFNKWPTPHIFVQLLWFTFPPMFTIFTVGVVVSQFLNHLLWSVGLGFLKSGLQ